MEALTAFEGGVCKCGFHESLATDRGNHFTFEDKHCPVCAGIAQYERIQHARDDMSLKRHEKPPPGMPRPSDGRRTFTRMLDSDEVRKVQEKTQGGGRRANT